MKILIVDDSKAMRMIVKRTLRQAELGEHETEEAGDGSEALPLVESWQPDLVLSDWNMPEMNGIELLRALRSEGNAVKLGFVTSESDPAMRDQAFQAGAAFMLTKPFTPEAVKAVLQPVLS